MLGVFRLVKGNKEEFLQQSKNLGSHALPAHDCLKLKHEADFSHCELINRVIVKQ